MIQPADSGEPGPCPHSYTWHLSPTDEAGWRCVHCDDPAPGEPPGYAPGLDVAQIEEKVRAILDALDDGEFIAISNATEGESLVGSVAEKCVAYGYYDQATIVRYIMTMSHDGSYWKTMGDAVRAGADPRDRCSCGKLATSWSVGGADRPTVARCREHGMEHTMGLLAADPRGPEGSDAIDPWEAYGNWVTAWRDAHPEDGRSELELIDEYARESP